MKNIFLFPTYKPSRLGYLTKKGKEIFKDLRLFDRLMPNILDSENQHIYITSDEEIENKNYILSDSSIGALYLDGIVNTVSMLAEGQWKKVVFTTDQDLIADGVQAIDDEFLEWFCSNSSCEEVDVIPLRKSSGWYDEKEVWHWDFLAYKIIIPKAEPIHYGMKEPNKVEGLISFTGETRNFTFPVDKNYEPNKHIEHVNTRIEELDEAIEIFKKKVLEKSTEIFEKYPERFNNDKSCIGNPETWGKRIIKETLKEAAEKYAEIYRCPATNDNEYCKHDIISAIKFGAKWQAEQNAKEIQDLKDKLDFVNKSITNVIDSVESLEKISYSEEDMRKAFIAGGNSFIEEDDAYGTEYLNYMEKWFEQFKNK